MKAMGGVHDHFLVRFYLSMTQGGGMNTVRRRHDRHWVASVLLVTRHPLDQAAVQPVLLPDLLIVVSVAGWRGGRALGLEAQRRQSDRRDSVGAHLGFEAPTIDHGAFVRQFWSGALAIAVLGLLEAISMAKVIVGADETEA
ncbi:MAG: hypothetical protein U0163_07535 [Gemmatimonadaceae bacterium]